MTSNAPKGKLHMSIITKRLVSIAASTLVLSLVSASANAQIIDVFTGRSDANYGFGGTLISTYTFTDQMVLNSIEFATNGGNDVVLSYKIGNAEFKTISNAELQAKDLKGYRRFDLGTGETIQSGTVVIVKQVGDGARGADHNGANSASNVTYTSFSGGSHLTNSNLRVSNPGSNVAPEPGSFALALTGGAALIGICVRRRRNAG